MRLNRRHKAILFVTLVFTGCALLLGAELNQALAFIMLGAALAWATGSEIASKLYAGLSGASGGLYAWIRLPLAMALAGAVLGAVLLYSRANPILAVVSMCSAGILIASVAPLPTRKIWLRIPLAVLGGVAFILAAGGMLSTDVVASNRYGERFGELSVTAFVALLVGIFWLSKGWRLIVQGISIVPPADAVPSTGTPKSAGGQYFSFVLGMIVLTLWLGLLAWLASSTWAYAPDKSTVTNGDNRLLAQVAFILVLALWPYRSWEIILRREPNSEPKYLRRHRRTAAIAGMIFVVALSLAVTYGIQNGNDQHMVEKITDTANDLTTVSTKIGAIKQRDLRTVGDYIQAYSEIEALLPEFESEIQRCADVYAEAREVDETRGFVNTQMFYRSHNSAQWKDDFEMLDLLRQFDSLTKQEALTVRNMAALPADKQVDFWQREFKPLTAQEDDLRERIRSLAAKIQSSTK
jgi:hypothetical protein